MNGMSLTDGGEIISIDECDCGLTGGCEKCHPISIPPYGYKGVTFITPQRIETGLQTQLLYKKEQ